VRRLAFAGLLAAAVAGVPSRPAAAPPPAHPPVPVAVPATVPAAEPLMLADRFEPPLTLPPPPPPLLVADPHCPGVEQVALAAGWPADPAVLATLDLIVFRESTCRAGAVNHGDPGSLGSIGWAQLNSAAWCDPTRWYPAGYLQTVGLITACDDLFDPLTNLRAALIVWQRAGGFSPWATAP
jgi:hypothetical protein